MEQLSHVDDWVMWWRFGFVKVCFRFLLLHVFFLLLHCLWIVVVQIVSNTMFQMFFFVSLEHYSYFGKTIFFFLLEVMKVLWCYTMKILVVLAERRLIERVLVICLSEWTNMKEDGLRFLLGQDTSIFLSFPLLSFSSSDRWFKFCDVMSL